MWYVKIKAYKTLFFFFFGWIRLYINTKKERRNKQKQGKGRDLAYTSFHKPKNYRESEGPKTITKVCPLGYGMIYKVRVSKNKRGIPTYKRAIPTYKRAIPTYKRV